MSDVAGRYRVVAGAFTERARAVPAGSWGNDAPCEGWTAIDIVGHMVEWMPAFLRSGADVAVPVGPPVEVDPVQSWLTMSNGIQAVLDTPQLAAGEFDHPRAGRHRLDDAIAMFLLGDVLVHTWDLARATGQDETLVADEVERMYAGLLPIDEMLRHDGHYGPRIDVADDSDTQTKLIAFTGRQP